MKAEPDYELLDRLGLGAWIFFPRRDQSEPPAGARDETVRVAEGVTVGCRFYPADPSWPSILLFHGNGEIASDYDAIAEALLGLAKRFLRTPPVAYLHEEAAEQARALPTRPHRRRQ